METSARHTGVLSRVIFEESSPSGRRQGNGSQRTWSADRIVTAIDGIDAKVKPRVTVGETCHAVGTIGLIRFLLIALVVLTTSNVEAKRAGSAKAEFQRMNHCPATGERRGRCPGYVIDHVQPLCAGGRDRPGNMQWQTSADAKVKDRIEARQCAVYRRQHLRAML